MLFNKKNLCKKVYIFLDQFFNFSKIKIRLDKFVETLNKECKN